MTKCFLILMSFLAANLYVVAQTNSGFYCQEAACLSQNLGLTINNSDSPLTPPYDFSCGISHNNLFFSFCPETGPVSLNINPSNCTKGLGVQAVIFETSDCEEFDELVCVSFGSESAFRLNFTGDPGKMYILMVDGYDEDYCDFTVSGSGIADVLGPPEEPILEVGNEDIILCRGESLELDINNKTADDCTLYLWRFKEGGGLADIKEKDEAYVLTTLESGTAMLCIEATNFCYTSEKCLNISIVPGLMIESIPDIEYCGQWIDFCDLSNGVLSPYLSPNPGEQGWTSSFYQQLAEAENSINPLSCPYRLNSHSTDTIWMRIEDGDCFETYDFIIFCPTSNVESNQSSIGLKLYPNPVQNDLMLEGMDLNQIRHYRIQNISGRIILHGESINGNDHIDVSSLKTGLYFLTLELNSTSYASKFIISH